MKNINSRFKITEKEIEIISSNKQQQKKFEEKRKSLRDLQENFKHTNISVAGIYLFWNSPILV